MKKSFMVIGLGRFGMSVVKTLAGLNADVVAVDINEECVQLAHEYVDHCLICDPTKRKVVQDLCVNKIDHAIVCIGNNLQATMLVTMNLKEANVKKITVRIDDTEYAPIMERLGATHIVIPEENSAVRLANEVVSDGILDYYEVAEGYAMIKLFVKDKFASISLKDLNARNKFSINIIGIIRDDDFILPLANDIIKAKDEIIVIGKKKDINDFNKNIIG